jgi:hypothetical protein
MKYNFIEIGTSDFDTLIQTYPDGSKGLYSIITSRWSMRALGAVTEITNLIPGGQEAIKHVVGAKDYEPITNTLIQALQVISAQSIILLTATLASLLFYRRNR